MCSQLLCFAVSLVVQLYYHFWRPEVSNIVGVLLQLGGPRANRFNGSFNCNEGDIYYHLLYYLFIYLFIYLFLALKRAVGCDWNVEASTNAVKPSPHGCGGPAGCPWA
jgi:hypothetical protein